MHHQKPVPLGMFSSKPRRVCAICGTPSYSASGVHPQCAQEKADREQTARLKAQQKAAPPKPAVENHEVLRPWHKRCPKCKEQVHVRKPDCRCGYRFPKIAAAR
ncbi:MAG: hypothetical protein WD066_19725 [Planctomycetaceae bacterium]